MPSVVLLWTVQNPTSPAQLQLEHDIHIEALGRYLDRLLIYDLDAGCAEGIAAAAF